VQQTSCARSRFFTILAVSVLVAAVAVDLAANFATGPGCAVDVHISGASADRFDQFVDFTGVDALSPRRRSGRNVGTNVGREDRARDSRRWRGTRLRASRTVAEVGAEKYAYAAVHTHVSKVYVGLLDCAFEIGIAEFPVNSRLVVTDSSIKRAGRGGGH